MFEKLTAADFDPVSADRCRVSGKKKFTKQGARRAAALTLRDHGKVLFHYRCPETDCRWFHLTSSPTRHRPGDPDHMGGKRSRR